MPMVETGLLHFGPSVSLAVARWTTTRTVGIPAPDGRSRTQLKTKLCDADHGPSRSAVVVVASANSGRLAPRVFRLSREKKSDHGPDRRRLSLRARALPDHPADLHRRRLSLPA